MKLLIAFGTDDGENFNDDHFGMAKHYHVYDFSNGKAELIEIRENTSFTGDETMKHGDPELVGKKFGPNLPRLLGKFVCVLVRTNTLASAIEAVRNNLGRILEEKNKGEGRKHIVLRP